mgnify:CR=1 FL=1
MLLANVLQPVPREVSITLKIVFLASPPSLKPIGDANEGSLRAAVEAKGPRTIVFRVSGTIILESDLRIKNPNITIAGQTAPGDGICLKKFPLIISADEVIIRYIRVRLGGEALVDADAVSSRYVKNLILDHVSASWSVDEVMSIYHGEYTTVQWCIIAESMFNSNHPTKNNHGFGGIWGSNYSTYHHNLIANNSNRNIRFASGCGNTDYRNNVIYNWGFESTYGGEAAQRGNTKFNFSNINFYPRYREVEVNSLFWQLCVSIFHRSPSVISHHSSRSLEAVQIFKLNY